jgi:hypothetical protein
VTPETPLLRLIHGAPIIAGVPVHYCLLLVGFGAVGVPVTMAINTVLAFATTLTVLGAWGGLAFIYRQDRVAVPLFLLGLRCRFHPVISSYSRSHQRVVLLEDE